METKEKSSMDEIAFFIPRRIRDGLFLEELKNLLEAYLRRLSWLQREKNKDYVKNYLRNKYSAEMAQAIAKEEIKLWDRISRLYRF
jgi:hypothetical protein